MLIPNERGLDNALALRDGIGVGATGVRRGQRLPQRDRVAQPRQRQPLGRGVAAAGSRPCCRARAQAGLRCEGVISVVLRLPVRGPRRAGARVRDRRAARSRPARRRSASATRPGWPTRCRCGAFFAAARRAARRPRRADGALPQHARAGPGERARRAARPAARASSRASASSAAARCRRARPATSPPRTSSRCCTRWASRPGSTSTRCSRRRAPSRDVLGRPLGSHTLIAGPVDWRLTARRRPTGPESCDIDARSRRKAAHVSSLFARKTSTQGSTPRYGESGPGDAAAERVHDARDQGRTAAAARSEITRRGAQRARGRPRRGRGRGRLPADRGARDAPRRRLGGAGPRPARQRARASRQALRRRPRGRPARRARLALPAPGAARRARRRRARPVRPVPEHRAGHDRLPAARPARPLLARDARR